MSEGTMQAPGLDHLVGTYGFYRGEDGYMYPVVPNDTPDTPHYRTMVSRVPDQKLSTGVPNEPPDVQMMAQHAGSPHAANYWHAGHQSTPPPLQNHRNSDGLRPLASDNKFDDPGGPRRGIPSIVSDSQPSTRLEIPPDRYGEASSAHIGGIVPIYLPPGEAYGSLSPPITPSTSNVESNSRAEESEESEHEPADDALPLIKLSFGAWKCGVCGKQLRRKHRAVVHFLNKHGDVRLRCQGRCGVVDCDKSFASQDGLDVHMNPVVVVCSACGKSLLKKNIIRHRSRHCHPQTTAEVLLANKDGARLGPRSASPSPQ